MAACWLDESTRRLWPSGSLTSRWTRGETARGQQVGNVSLVKMMTLCFRGISAPLCRNTNVRCLVSARSAPVCLLEPVSWRLRYTPVTEFARLKRPPVSGSYLARLKGTDSRVACWSGVLQQGKQTPWHVQGPIPMTQGGHERHAASFRFLLSPRARGLCSGKTDEKPDTSTGEERGDSGTVPGHGLFKFKELVSTEVTGVWTSQKGVGTVDACCTTINKV